MRVIKKVGKEYHVESGFETIFKTDDFEVARDFVLDEDEKKRANKELEELLHEEMDEARSPFPMNGDFEKISAIKSEFEFYASYSNTGNIEDILVLDD